MGTDTKYCEQMPEIHNNLNKNYRGLKTDARVLAANPTIDDVYPAGLFRIFYGTITMHLNFSLRPFLSAFAVCSRPFFSQTELSVQQQL